MRRGFAAVLVAAGCTAIEAWAEDLDRKANPAAQLELPAVDVVGTTPLPIIGAPLNEVPANVQSATGADMQRQQSLNLPEYLNNNLGSVTINESQGNPFQPDVSFRGFTVSPLLGFPQGLSVFQDGVRINEPLGDVVNWDLIPQGAISSMTLIPGSNPVFGLNTLGGALSINTKSGREYPGGSLSAFGGSYGTRSGNVEYGGARDNFDYYVYGNYYDSNGWKDNRTAKSLVQQLFGKFGYQTSDFDADLSYSYSDNRLFGAQTLPAAMYAADDRLPYTFPDSTRNLLNFVNLRLSQVWAEDKILAGNLYWRDLASTNLSSNVNGDFDGSSSGAACDGTTAGTLCPAGNVQTVTDTAGAGGTLQLTMLTGIGAHKNSLSVGASYDSGRTRFRQSGQNAVFDASRDTIGTGSFAPMTGVRSINQYAGSYFTDTFGITDSLPLTIAGRYNVARIRLNDELGTVPGIDGTSTFQRFNPALGLNYNPTKAINSYISYNEGMRAPTPVELTCADPSAPCPLPNAFVSDPPLRAVVAKTFELGARGSPVGGTAWSAALYRTNLYDDIQFVSGSPSGTTGFFTNIPRTRRQGVELNLKQQLGSLTMQAAYGYVDATYRSEFTLPSPNNSSANAAGNIQVAPGNRIPNIPRSTFKLRADWRATGRMSIGGALVYAGGRYPLGNENNQDSNGRLPGYVVVNLDGRYQISEDLQLFAKINNVFDRKYETAGVLGQNFFTGPHFTYNAAGVQPTVFGTPGAPLTIWAGVRYDFAKPAKDQSR